MELKGRLPISSWEQAMLYSRPSRAMLFVKPEMACFDIVYDAASGRGEYAEMDPLLMILQSGAIS